jgi:hypothetical protein
MLSASAVLMLFEIIRGVYFAVCHAEREKDSQVMGTFCIHNTITEAQCVPRFETKNVSLRSVAGGEITGQHEDL